MELKFKLLNCLNEDKLSHLNKLLKELINYCATRKRSFQFSTVFRCVGGMAYQSWRISLQTHNHNVVQMMSQPPHTIGLEGSCYHHQCKFNVILKLKVTFLKMLPKKCIHASLRNFGCTNFCHPISRIT